MEMNENDNPLVSVIMPVHNDSKYLLDSISSVLNQTYRNLELLIIDDGSIDGSEAIINGFDDERIRKFINKSSIGAAGARNIALRNARGKYIAFLDADDYWALNKLEFQINYMERNGLDFTCSRYTVVNSKKLPLCYVCAPSKISRRMLYHCCYLGCLTAVYNQKVTGLIQVDERLKKRNDYAIWLQVIQKTKYCFFLDKNLAFYRRNDNGISSKKSTLLLWHYRLFRYQMLESPIVCLYRALINFAFYFYKKIKFQRKIS